MPRPRFYSSPWLEHNLSKVPARSPPRARPRHRPVSRIEKQKQISSRLAIRKTAYEAPRTPRNLKTKTEKETPSVSAIFLPAAFFARGSVILCRQSHMRVAGTTERLLATLVNFIHKDDYHPWTLPKPLPQLQCGPMKKSGLATGELQKAFPPIFPAERSVDPDARGIIVGVHDRQP